MARVEAADITAVLSTTIDVSAFITTAALIVSENLEDKGLSEDRLKEIERYLAAHFACMMDPREEREQFGDASNTYQGKTGMALDATFYGQTAKLLDTSGTLINLNKPKAKLEMI